MRPLQACMRYRLIFVYIFNLYRAFDLIFMFLPAALQVFGGQLEVGLHGSPPSDSIAELLPEGGRADARDSPHRSDQPLRPH